MNKNETNDLQKQILKNLALFMAAKWTTIIVLNKVAKRMAEKP